MTLSEECSGMVWVGVESRCMKSRVRDLCLLFATFGQLSAAASARWFVAMSASMFYQRSEPKLADRLRITFRCLHLLIGRR